MQFSLPTNEVRVLLTGGKKEKIIPYITPVAICEEKVALFDRLLREINSIEPTGVSLDSGTVTAMQLDKSVDDWKTVDSMLTSSKWTDADGTIKAGISPLDFAFLRKLRHVNLLSLRQPTDRCGRSINIRQEDGMMHVTEASIGNSTARHESTWLLHRIAVPGEQQLDNRRPEVTICLPLDDTAHALLRSQTSRIFTTLPTYNEPDSHALFSDMPLLIEAHFTLNPGRTGLLFSSDTKGWNKIVLRFIGEELPKAIMAVLSQQTDTRRSSIFRLIPHPERFPHEFKSAFENALQILKGSDCVRVQDCTFVKPSKCVLPPMDLTVRCLFSITDDTTFELPSSHEEVSKFVHAEIEADADSRWALQTTLNVQMLESFEFLRRMLLGVNVRDMGALWQPKKEDTDAVDAIENESELKGKRMCPWGSIWDQVT